MCDLCHAVSGRPVDDIAVVLAERRFHYRVGALIVRAGQLLAVTNDAADYFYSVGGCVRAGETSEHAVIREVYEETGTPLAVERLAFVVENFFVAQGERYHEISLYYQMTVPDSFVPCCRSNSPDGVAERLQWLPLAEMERIDFRPAALKLRLMRPIGCVEHIVCTT